MRSQSENHFELNSEEVERYSRQLLLPEIGEKGQRKLKASSVACIGCGGLGSPLLIYLASAGIGKIGLIDSDLVDRSNLQRQIIHSTNWIGKDKTVSARSRIIEINPNCNVEIFNSFLTNKNALEILKDFDIICDCTDNFESRYLINDACLILEKPMIFGAVSKFEGQATVFNLTKDSPSFRDFIPEPPPQSMLPSCSQLGVMGIVPGLIGIIQATEVIKIITGIGNVLDGRVLVINSLTMKFKELRLYKSKDRKNITELIDYKSFLSSFDSKESDLKSISVKDLKALIETKPEKILIIDVRTSLEYNNQSIHSSISIPLKNIEAKKDLNKIKYLSKGKDLYIHCQSGIRSKKAIRILKENGINSINITGGMDAWNKEL